MDGVEKIIARIQGDIQQKIEEINAAAQRDADAIARRCQDQADQETEEAIAQARKDAALLASRLDSNAQLEGKKAVLACKQELLNAAFDQALTRLTNLPEEELVSFLSRLAAQVAQTGKEQLILSQKDGTRYGARIVMEANALLAGQGRVAELTLSEKIRPIVGGFILSSEDVEVNCTFEAMLRFLRNEMAGQIAKELFD